MNGESRSAQMRRFIGADGMPYIIAEIGFNHEGDMGAAKKMIAAAAATGADAVKFQTYRASDLALPSSPHFKAIACGEMGFKQHAELARTAKTHRVDFLSTPYSVWAVDLLEKIGVPLYKIASMDLTNIELLRHAAKTGKPLLISTGMASLPEIRKTVAMLRRMKSGPVTMLHCLSKYPACPEDINLAFMDTISRECRCPVGYSDHMIGTHACLAAAVLGASVIEKHFTLDSTKRGADHYHSADPIQLRKLIEDIRLVIKIVGSKDRSRRADRADAIRFRRGVYAAVDIPTGQQIRREHLVCCRPEAEFSPSDIDKIVGCAARINIAANSPIMSKHI